MRIRLLLNEKARRAAQSAPLVHASLRSCGIEAVESDDVDAVVAAGGDGTIISAAAEAIRRGVPLGIIPLGTFNDLAYTLAIPTDIEEACRTIVDGRARAIDVGRVNGAYFVNEASIGISTRIARRQTPQIKRRYGVLAIIGTSLQAFVKHRMFAAHIEYGDHAESFRTIQMTIANSRHFGGLVDVPGSTLDDGLLDLFSVEITHWLGIIPIVHSVLTHSETPVDGVRHRRASKFSVRTRHAHHVSADGEPAGFTPAVFEVLPLALRVIVPRASPEKET